MTRQEALKRRIRARMAKTGERYTTARRALLETSGGQRRTWVAPPETSDEAVTRATGRGWDEWVDIIEAGPHGDADHPAIAAWLQAEQDLSGWWAQTVTVGFERITGRRLPYQRPDGTFTASKSATVDVDAAVLRALLLNDEDRAGLFPDQQTELRSKPTSKSIRIRIGPGDALFGVSATGDRTKVTIAHEKLPTFDLVEEWKFYWSDWLAALAD